MKKVLVFGASNSGNSINRQLALYAGAQINNCEIDEFHIKDLNLPIYSPEMEKEHGIPKDAQSIFDRIGAADGVVISFAEHNGSFSAAYKNLYDWMSRIQGNVFQSKALFLMATSPGARGGQGVLKHAEALYSYGNKNKGVAATFSLPSFNENFNTDIGLTSEYKNLFDNQLKQFLSALS